VYKPKLGTTPCLLSLDRRYNTLHVKYAYWSTVHFIWTLYRVIHKSLRDFRTRLRNNQDRHGRKEHINRERERETLQNWRDSLPIDMLLSAVSVLVVAQSSSEIPEGLMNNTVYRFSTNAQYGYYFFLPWRNSPQLCQGQLIIEVSRSLSDTPH